MNTEDVRLFLAIVRSRSINGAAQELFLAQSTVSRRLSALEKELGLQLFLRAKGVNTVHLTADGERFLPIAQQLITLEDEALSIARRGRAQHLSIAAPDSLAAYVLKDFLYRFSVERPTWDLEIEVHDTAQIHEMLSGNTLDIGITNGEAPYANLQSTCLFEEDFVLLRRGTPPLGEAPAVELHELQPQHEIYQFFSTEYNHWHNFHWDPQNAKLRVNVAKLAAGFLHDAEDWAILPRSAARSLLPQDGYIAQLRPSPPKRRCYFITHKRPRPDRTAAIGEVYRELTAYIAALQQQGGL